MLKYLFIISSLLILVSCQNLKGIKFEGDIIEEKDGKVIEEEKADFGVEISKFDKTKS